MPGILVRWLVTTLAVLVVPYLISGVTVKDFWSALLAGAVLGILNALVRPVLIILTLPLTVITLGIFILIINALLFQLAGAIVPGLEVSSFGSAFLAGLVVSVVSWLANSVITGGPGEKTVIVRQWQGDSIDLRRGKDGKWE